MRKFKIITFSVLCVAIVSLFVVEIFAAVYLNVRITGNIQYTATEIGAKIWGTKAWNKDGEDGTSSYLTLSGSGTFVDDVYYVSGDENSYTNITSTIGTTTFSSKQDTVELYLFIKNVGDRYIIPSVSVQSTDVNLVADYQTYYFDVSLGHIDPLLTKSNTASADGFLSLIDAEISASNYSAFSVNSSMDNEDVFCTKVILKLADDASVGGSTQINSEFVVNVSFMADVQYESNDILSVYQTENQSASTWTKFGYNATLEANATKTEENNISNLELYLRQSDANGNANISVARDDYHNEIVYKDIDNVNVDINTGELIGFLSDVDYPFEWYGRDVTLPAGTVLASGRTLTTSETFTVDVYTKYPTMYVRRWVVGGEQWLSVSDKDFTGAVKIDEYYTATFEATVFNSDGSVATNDYGVITRSYVTDHVPLTSGSVNYLQTNYDYLTVDQDGNVATATSSTTQSQMLAWANNLTKAWKNSGLDNAYRTAQGVQGENWTVYVFNILYLIKYANNNSQEIVGYGNTYTYSLYSASGVTVTSSKGNIITTGGSTNAYYESEKGGGAIGVYNSSSKGTATYDENHKMSSTGYNNAGMNYGYNSLYTFGSHKTGLYGNQFMTYSTGTDRYLLDGYVGSNRYTSVFCLGMCNPWGNVWTWVFGNAVISDGTNLFAYTIFEDYNAETSNYQLSSSSADFSTKDSLLISMGYTKMTYNLPSTEGYKRYLGTSAVTSENGIESLVGLPSADSSSGGTTTGLCDYYYCNKSTDYIFGVLRGGNTGSTATAGAFYFSVNAHLSDTSVHIGFRPSLIS